MKKALLIASLFAAVMVIGVTQATAQQDQITVTVTVPSVISVSLSLDAWVIDDIALSETRTSTSITATNNGNVAETFTIASDDSTNWTCETTAGSDNFTMKAQGGDLTSYTSICDTGHILETPVAVGIDVSFTLQFTAPTATASIGVAQTIAVTVTASLPAS